MMGQSAAAWLERAKQSHQSGQYAVALREVSESLELDPQQAEAWNLKGAILKQQGRSPDALMSYDRALTIDPQFYKAWINKGILLAELQRYEGSIACYQMAMNLKPDLPGLGDRLNEVQRKYSIVSRTSQTIVIPQANHTDENETNEDAEIWLNRGAQQGMARDFQGALTSFNQAITLKPQLHEAWMGRGITLSALGRKEDAIESYNKAVQIKPDLHEAWMGRGNALSALGLKEEAIVSYDKALEIKPDDRNVWYNRGNTLYDLERKEEAIASYDQALQFQPNDQEVWFVRGSALSSLGLKEEAIVSYDKALEIKPDDHNVWYNRGNALYDLERKEEAIASYDKALNIKPDKYAAWYERGVALSNLGRKEEAIASYDKALNIKPDMHEAWLNRGNALCVLERYEEAIESHDKALEINQDNYIAWNSRGVSLVYLGRKREAIASFDQALMIKSNYNLAWLNRGGLVGSFIGDHLPDSTTRLIEKLHQPALSHQGYVGELASYETGLRYLAKNQIEQWNQFFHAIISKAKKYFDDTSINTLKGTAANYIGALDILTLESFPIARLATIQSLIRVELNLRNTAAARKYQIEGIDIFNNLFKTDYATGQKKKIEELFSGFSQITVDVLVQDNQSIAALRTADRNKNRALNWILEDWQEPTWSPTYPDIQRLLTSFDRLRTTPFDDLRTTSSDGLRAMPSRAALYWHLSPDTLTTFFLQAHAPEPLVFTQPIQPLQDWLKTWSRDYQNYRDKAKDPSVQADSPWRNGMAQQLDRLKAILQLPPLTSDITELLLIPHRDLHRLPLHALFDPDYTITYLPSLSIGLNLQQRPSPHTIATAPLLSIEAPKHTNSDDLPYARIESSILCQRLSAQTRLATTEATLENVTKALHQKNHRLLHFTGHGFSDPSQPQQSCLLLAGGDRLTAATIVKNATENNLPLSHYDLVTLAGCETAITHTETLETEYVGLVSAFLKAGVAQVVTSLWTIEDGASTWFMIRFYELLLEHRDAAIALRKTQTWMRDLTYEDFAKWLQSLLPDVANDLASTARLESAIRIAQKESSTIGARLLPFQSPYYWAAFTLTGRVTP